MQRVYGYTKFSGVDTNDYQYQHQQGDSRPSSFKLSSKYQLPPVLDQLKLGSCSANGISNAYLFEEYKKGNTDCSLPSRLFIYFNERSLEHDINKDSGACLRDGMKSISKT